MARDYYPGQFPKTCTKCRTAYTEEAWAALDALEPQEVCADPTDTDRPEAHSLDLRNCACGTTLAVAFRSAP